jgi:hypothetical protein
MDHAELDRLGERVGSEIRRRFPDAPIQRVELLQYGDRPGIEPGQLLARVHVQTPGGEDDHGLALDAFHDAHRAAIQQLRRDLDKLPALATVEFVASGDAGHQKQRIIRLHPLTPVMARLGTDDLQTLDTLITAGIASSRSEGVRWALARIRERPAYEQLRTRAQEIEQLKTQF